MAVVEERVQSSLYDEPRRQPTAQHQRKCVIDVVAQDCAIAGWSDVMAMDPAAEGAAAQRVFEEAGRGVGSVLRLEAHPATDEDAHVDDGALADAEIGRSLHDAG